MDVHKENMKKNCVTIPFNFWTFSSIFRERRVGFANFFEIVAFHFLRSINERRQKFLNSNK